MTDHMPQFRRRRLFASSSAAQPIAGGGSSAIRPFRVNVPDTDLADLRKRVNATRWPERETVKDQAQGVQLATMQKLARYWGTEYDWRKCEARLNAYPHFITEIDGLDIHFIHVRSKHENALPLIVTHGWPGSVVEQLKIIEPLTNPTAHGGAAADAFHVVIPSIPGYGFSARPNTTGWDVAHIARAWVVLMKRLGYTKFVAQGGDWGAIITDQLGVQAAPELLGIHLNMAGVFPPEIDGPLFAGGPVPQGLPDEERRACEQAAAFYKTLGYGFQLGRRPQSMYGLADSPVGVAASLRRHHAGRHPRQPHAHLADQHRRLFCPSLLGSLRARHGLLHRQGRQDPSRRERVPGRAL
jgi:pimeloyl-ACP methyl ester carboxylesterase